MSQQRYEDDDDDDDNNNRRQSKSSRSKLVPDDSISGRQLWLYGFCGCIIISCVLFFGMVAFSWHRGGVASDHINQVIMELNEDNTQQLDTKNMVSFSALSTRSVSERLIGSNNKLSLCYGDLLKSDTDDGKGDLIDDVDQLSQDKKPFYFILDLKLTMAFDVNPILYMRQQISEYETTRRYMTVAYLISSSYAHFSTIKLVETGLDTRSKALILTKEVILCSDNPSAQGVRSCVAGGFRDTNEREGLFIKNTVLLTMSKLVPWGGRKNNTANKQATTTPTSTSRDNSETAATTDNGQYDIVTSESNINNYKVADDYTKDVRFYNIVFYRSVPSDDSSRYNTFKEVPVLTIKPNKCK